MPVVRVGLDDIEAAVANVERSARVIQVAITGGAAIILYEDRQPQARETRGGK